MEIARIVNIIFGTDDYLGIIVGFHFCILGYGTNLLWGYVNRKDKTKDLKINWTKDNIARLILNLIFMFIGMRFGSEIFNIENLLWLGFIIGFGNDLISQFIVKTIQNKFEVIEEVEPEEPLTN